MRIQTIRLKNYRRFTELTIGERGGRVRSFHVPKVNAKTLKPILKAQISASSRVMTDEAGVYGQLGRDFAEHETVNHSIGEYVRGDAHTNTAENYFSHLQARDRWRVSTTSANST